MSKSCVLGLQWNVIHALCTMSYVCVPKRRGKKRIQVVKSRILLSLLFYSFPFFHFRFDLWRNMPIVSKAHKKRYQRIHPEKPFPIPNFHHIKIASLPWLPNVSAGRQKVSPLHQKSPVLFLSFLFGPTFDISQALGQHSMTRKNQRGENKPLTFAGIAVNISALRGLLGLLSTWQCRGIWKAVPVCYYCTYGRVCELTGKDPKS